MKKLFRRLLILASVIVISFLLIFLFRTPILKGIGNLLVDEDHPVLVDAAFVLSGSANERAIKATECYKAGFAPKLVATGSQISGSLLAAGLELKDADLMKKALIDQGVDSTDIRLLREGTSTFEESEEILGYATLQGYTRIMIITSKFHTNRVKKVFTSKLKKAGISVVVVGAEPVNYEISSWWRSEEGLIFVNNEYVKSIYYWLKY